MLRRQKMSVARSSRRVQNAKECLQLGHIGKLQMHGNCNPAVAISGTDQGRLSEPGRDVVRHVCRIVGESERMETRCGAMKSSRLRAAAEPPARSFLASVEY